MERLRRLLLVFLSCVLVFSFCVAANAGTDYEGHWASSEISEWASRGLIRGYDDGSFRPDFSITRVELMALANRIFGFIDINGWTSHEVPETDWRFSEMARAVSAGYIQGYPDGTIRPDHPVLRQEVAVILSRLLAMAADTDSPSGFVDAGALAAWSRGFVGAASSEGYILGYPDGTFRPTNSLTRAELVAVLHRVAAMICDMPGTYGRSSDPTVVGTNLIVTAPEVTLDNIRVHRRLIISGSASHGPVALNHVVVEGPTLLNGDITSMYLSGTDLNALEILRGEPRIVLGEGSSIDCVVLRSPAQIEGGANIRSMVIHTNGVVLDEAPEELLIDEGVVAIIGGVEVVGTGSIKPPDPEQPPSPPLPPPTPAIVSIDDVAGSVEVGDTYRLPSTVTAKMSNNTTRQVAVTWTAPPGVTIVSSTVRVDVTGVYKFTGTVSDYNKDVVLWLAVNRSRATGTITWTVIE